MTMYIACDTETTGLNMFGGDAPFAFSFTRESGNTSYYRFYVNPSTREVDYASDVFMFETMKHIYENPKTEKIFHNASFDVKMLASIGIEVAGRIHDTMILAHVLNNNRLTYGLKPLAK